MSAPTDGGPAFPHRGLNNDGCTDIIAPGMTLRDWFAGQALAGMDLEYRYKPNTDLGCAEMEPYAKRAYAQADALLAAREQKGAKP